MGGQVIGANVGLDFDDPANSYAGDAISDQSAADQGTGDVLAVAGQQLARIWHASGDGMRLAQGKIATRSLGSRPDRMWTIGGTNVSWIAPPMWDWLISRS